MEQAAWLRGMSDLNVDDLDADSFELDSWSAAAEPWLLRAYSHDANLWDGSPVAGSSLCYNMYVEGTRRGGLYA